MKAFATTLSDLFVLRRLIRCLLGGLVLINCHCATQSQLSEKAAVDRPADTTKGSEGGQLWYLQSEPNTYFPKGIDSKIETDSRSGEWVYTKEGDFFIPHAQLPSEQRRVLLADALDRGIDRRRMKLATQGEKNETTSELMAGGAIGLVDTSLKLSTTAALLGIGLMGGALSEEAFESVWTSGNVSVRNFFQTWPEDD